MAIRPEQMTAYDDASKVIERAVQALEAVNVARFNPEDLRDFHDLVVQTKAMRHRFFKESHDAFLRERGLK